MTSSYFRSSFEVFLFYMWNNFNYSQSKTRHIIPFCVRNLKYIILQEIFLLNYKSTSKLVLLRVHFTSLSFETQDSSIYKISSIILLMLVMHYSCVICYHFDNSFSLQNMLVLYSYFRALECNAFCYIFIWIW